MPLPPHILPPHRRPRRRTLAPRPHSARLWRMDSMAYQPFPNTHWSLVRRAGRGRGATPNGEAAASPDPADAAAQRDALAILLSRYQPALRSYLRVIRRLPADDADDLLQAFITDQLLAYHLLARADQSRGRFRTLLLTSLNNFAISRARAAGTRAVTPLDAQPRIDPRTPEPTHAVECAWARALIHQVIDAMRTECHRTHRPDIWAVFEGRILAEVFGNAADGSTLTSYETLARTLKLDSPAQAANLLVTAKRMYARLLRAAVAQYERHPEDIDAEITDLRRLLQTPPGPE